MEDTKEIKIEVPEGYEIDRKLSTFECIKFKKAEKVETYEDVLKTLFKKDLCYMNHVGIVCHRVSDDGIKPWHVCTSEHQAERLKAINKVLNVAKYVNGDWNIDFNYSMFPLYMFSVDEYGDIKIVPTYSRTQLCFFNTKKDAERALKIIGKGIIRRALSNEI